MDTFLQETRQNRQITKIGTLVPIVTRVLPVSAIGAHIANNIQPPEDKILATLNFATTEQAITLDWPVEKQPPHPDSAPPDDAPEPEGQPASPAESLEGTALSDTDSETNQLYDQNDFLSEKVRNLESAAELQKTRLHKLVQSHAHSQGVLLGEELKVAALTENLSKVQLKLRNSKNETAKLEETVRELKKTNQRLVTEIDNVQRAVSSEFEAHQKRTIKAVEQQLSPATKQSLANKRHCKAEPSTPK